MTKSKYTLPKGVSIQSEKLDTNTTTGDFEVMLVGENTRQKAESVCAPYVVGNFRFEIATDSWYLDGKLVSIEDVQEALMKGLMVLRRTYLFENHCNNHILNKGK